MNPLLSILLTLFTFFVMCVLANLESCTTYEGTKGTCVNIKQCPLLLNLLKRRKFSSTNALSRLRKSQCGFDRLDPKVCCDNEISDDDQEPNIPSQSIESIASPFNAIGDSYSVCKTVSGSEGTCISVSQCPSQNAIFGKETTVSGAALEMLKQSLCGFEKMMPKVCCIDHQRPATESTQSHKTTSSDSVPQELCITSRGTYGVCVSIKNCQPLFTLLKQSSKFSYVISETLKGAHCGFEGMDPKVCCENEQPSSTIQSYHRNDEKPIPIPDVTDHPNLELLDHDLCGPISEAKIIGGTKTAVFEFPWMALIAYDTGIGIPEFRCGGSLITRKHVLTAAHCIASLPPHLGLVGVRLGEHDLSKERDCDIDINGLDINCADDYQDFSILGVAVHPDYPKDKLQDDIALILLDGEANFQAANVRPICLPIGLSSVLHPKMTVTGWGATERGPRSQTLRKVTLPIVPYKECARLYKMRNINIWYKQICAGGSNRTDSCSGDSGGPLQTLGMYNGKPRTILYGIVSFGPRDCGSERIPGVYTQVEYYMDWILDTIGTDIYDD